MLFDEGTSWNGREGAAEVKTEDTGFEEGTALMPLTEDDGTDPESDPAKVGCMRFLGFRFAMRVCTCSPPLCTVAGAALPKSWL